MLSLECNFSNVYTHMLNSRKQGHTSRKQIILSYICIYLTSKKSKAVKRNGISKPETTTCNFHLLLSLDRWSPSHTEPENWLYLEFFEEWKEHSEYTHGLLLTYEGLSFLLQNDKKKLTWPKFPTPGKIYFIYLIHLIFLNNNNCDLFITFYIIYPLHKLDH